MGVKLGGWGTNRVKAVKIIIAVIISLFMEFPHIFYLLNLQTIFVSRISIFVSRISIIHANIHCLYNS